MELTHRNHNQLAPTVYRLLRQAGIPETSRNGPVLRLPGVTTLVVDKPWQRVNFSPARDANPFFHLIEAMCMLAPMNDIKFLSHFAKRMLQYSDDGETMNAFYGTRALRTWGDQITTVIAELRRNPASRQCVVNLWDPADLTKATKDKACNLCMIFSVARDGSLEMTTFNRSNDAIWGMCSGANVVHFSFFQEYVACALGRPMGLWRHASANLHVYTDNPQWEALLKDCETYDRYSVLTTPHIPLFEAGREALFHPTLVGMLEQMKERTLNKERYLGTDVLILRTDTPLALENPFLFTVFLPVFNAWQMHKAGRTDRAIQETDLIAAEDWRSACRSWLRRRAEKGGGK